MTALEGDFGSGKAVSPTVLLGTQAGNGPATPGAAVTLRDPETGLSVSCRVATDGTCIPADVSDYTALSQGGLVPPVEDRPAGAFYFNVFDGVEITQTDAGAGFFQYPTVTHTLTIDACSNLKDCARPDFKATFFDGYLASIGVGVTDSHTGKPVPGAAYLLCSDQSASRSSASATAAGCSPGGTLATATSGPDGTLTFPGTYPSDGSYFVVETTGPQGYAADPAQHPVSIADPPTADAIGVVNRVAVELDPVAAPTTTATVTTTSVTTVTTTPPVTTPTTPPVTSPVITVTPTTVTTGTVSPTTSATTSAAATPTSTTSTPVTTPTVTTTSTRTVLPAPQPAPAAPGLAATGVDTGRWIGWAALLAGFGAVFLGLGRRRPARRH